MRKFLIVFEINVEAETPGQASIIARDILLNPDASLIADVHEYEYNKDAWDWFANMDAGWCADFRHGGVRPDQLFAIEKSKH